MQSPPETIDLFGWAIDTELLLKLAVAALAPILVLAAKALMNWKRRKKDKLIITIPRRLIVAEIVDDVPVKLIDNDGNEIENIYAFFVRLWNNKKEPILGENISTSSPLKVTVSDDARVLNATVKPSNEDIACAISHVEGNSYAVTFDCLNPDDYVTVCIYATGTAYSAIDTSGRLFGHDILFDGVRNEDEASFEYRLMCGLLAAFVTISPLLFVASIVIAAWKYSLTDLFLNQDALPKWLAIMFGLGFMVTFMFVFYFATKWYQRREHPKGFPIPEDYQPSQWETIKLYWLTAVSGRRYDLVSASIYDYGEPIQPKSELQQMDRSQT